ncbi:hypothetical protein HCJ76_44330 [Streptomyces sp. MC1]|uniref:hypothetical protein n=1 Tax=Streptomyces sp. MC1 TaxID=295105 RepID=UPI0018CAD06E|nr:hypothetical protein [Streptomyces sp. MC1]MBG7704913.1 hypothetical protein [Streptomyces sp. MC1]
MAEGMQAGRLEVTVVASLEGFARELKLKVEAAAEGVSAKIGVKVDGKGLRRQLKRVVEEASKGVSAKVRVKVEEDRGRLRREVSALTDEAAQGAAVNLPVRLSDSDDNGRTGGRTGGGSLGRLVNRLRGSLRSVLNRVARDPEASTARVRIAPSRDSERTFSRSLSGIAAVALRQLRVVSRSALAPTQGLLRNFVREMGRIAAVAGRDTGRAFSRAFWTMLGSRAGMVRGLASMGRGLVARVRLGVASTADAVRGWSQEARHFLTTYSRDLVARVRIAGLTVRSTDFRAIGREMRRLGEEAADALRLAFGGRMGGGRGWIDSLITGPMRDMAVRVRVGVQMSRRAAVDFGRSVRDLSTRYRSQFVVGVRMAADSSRNAVLSFGRSVHSAITPYSSAVAARVRVLTEPARTAVTGLARDLRRITSTAARDTRSAIRVAVQPAARAVRDLTRGVGSIVGRATRAATSVVRARVRADNQGNLFTRSLRGILRAGQALLNRNPLNIPINPQAGGRGGRRRFRMALIGSLLALLQPAAAVLSQYMYGLTALVSAAAPAVGVLGAIPGLIAAAGTAAIATKVAFSGFGKALKEAMQSQQQLAAGGKATKAQQQQLKQAMDQLSPSAQKAVKAITGLSGAWKKVRNSVSERFFSKIDGDIEPLAKSTLPLLKSVLGDAAGQMGDLAHRGAEFMQTGVFRRDFKKIAGTSSTVIGHMTDGLANLGHASMDFLVASGPFVERVGAGVEKMTAWVRSSVQAGRETGSLAKFLDHAGQKAGQLGRATRDMFKGFGGIGKAGMDVGNTLLDGLEGTMTRFDRWANSKPGQKAMKGFFEESAGTFHEINRMIGDTMRAFGRAARDRGVTDLIRQIRLELGPALGAFFNSIGHNIGPALISLISNLATAIGNLSKAGSGLGILMVAFSGLLNSFNWLTTKLPFINTALATFLGIMLALKIISGVTSIITRLGTATRLAATNLRSLGTTMSGALGPGQMGPQITGMQRITSAYRSAAQQGGRFRGVLSGIRAANRGAVSALGGLTGALGGPLGIAITAATIGLGLLASKQEENARAAQAHRERVDSLATALAQSNGLIDANVRAQAVQLLQDTELADGKGRLVDTMRDAGVSLKELTDAYLEQDGSVDGLKKKLLDLAKAHMEYRDLAAGKVSVLEYDEEGQRYKDAADALGSVNGELKKGKRDAKEQGDALRDSGAIGVDSYTRLNGAVKAFNDQTKTSDERVQALKAALDDLKGNTMSIHDAETKLNQAMLQVDDSMKETKKHADGWGKSLIGADKLVNTSTKNGQALNEQLLSLRDGMLEVGTAAREAADNKQITLAEAMNTTRDAAEGARKKAIALAEALGLPAPAAKELADQMGLIPSEVTSLVTTKGAPKATQDVVGLKSTLDSIKPGKSIQIDAPTIAARTQLEALGYTFQRIPGSKKVVVTAPTGGARVDLNALVQDIAATPDKKKVTVQTIISKATADLKTVQGRVASLKENKSITVKAPTAVAQKALKDLGYKIENVDKGGKKVKITAPNKTPLAQVQAIQDKINGLVGTTVHVTVQYSEKGKPAVVRTHADGAIVRYAEGGIRAASARIKAFANGAENHIAQIGKPGDPRIWNEPETKGEAYVPLAPSKRTRSKAILDQVAKMFGGMVVYPGQGAMKAFANGAVSLARSAAVRTVTASSASPPQGAGALVGGDLNLNIGAVASTGTALQDAMFELRRIRLGGSYA